MEYNLPSEIVKDLTFGNDAKTKIIKGVDKLTKAVKSKNLMAYKHTGFWFCIDTLRDKKLLETMIKNKKSPWLK